MNSSAVTTLLQVCLLVVLCSACQKEIEWQFLVTTYAGGIESGPTEGTIDTVLFEDPNNIAIDDVGNVFVTDRENHWIRKITPGGMVTTLAGRKKGYVDARGDSARFDSPKGIAVNAAGYIYVADRDNNRIRRISPEGVVSTLAGSGVPGYVDGDAASAQFDHPRGLTCDRAGNFYISDTRNHRIRKITPAGMVVTVAGSGVAGFAEGNGTSAQFNNPVGIAIDRSGNIYVADSDNHRIRKITPGGEVSTIAGDKKGYSDGPGATARFNDPQDVVTDGSGNIYVADRDNDCIRKITPGGEVSTIAGNGAAGFADGFGFMARFNNPVAVAVDAQGKSLYVADSENFRIRRISLSTK